MCSFLCVSMKFQPISASFAQVRRYTQDFRAVYFNLFLVILPNFGSLFYTSVIPYKPLFGTPLLGLPVVLHCKHTTVFPPPQRISTTYSGRGGYRSTQGIQGITAYGYNTFILNFMANPMIYRGNYLF